MPTIRTLSERALRMLGELPASEDISAEDEDVALEAFRAMFTHLVGTRAFGKLTSVLKTDETYEAGENERVIGATTVTLPASIADCGVVRPVKDRSCVVVAGSTPETYVYDADLDAWVGIHGLTAGSEAPLANRFSDALAALLAVRLATEFGSIITAEVAERARVGRAALRRRDPIRAQPVEGALLRANPNAGLSSAEASVDVTTIGAEIPDMEAIFYSALNA